MPKKPDWWPSHLPYPILHQNDPAVIDENGKVVVLKFMQFTEKDIQQIYDWLSKLGSAAGMNVLSNYGSKIGQKAENDEN